MPIISECSYPGCGVKTIGPLCVTHDLPVWRTFPRGRGLDRPRAVAAAPAGIGNSATPAGGSTSNGGTLHTSTTQGAPQTTSTP